MEVPNSVDHQSKPDLSNFSYSQSQIIQPPVHIYHQLVGSINGDMFTKVQATRNTTLLPIQDVSMYCLPCLLVRGHDVASKVTTYYQKHGRKCPHAPAFFHWYCNYLVCNRLQPPFPEAVPKEFMHLMEKPASQPTNLHPVPFTTGKSTPTACTSVLSGPTTSSSTSAPPIDLEHAGTIFSETFYKNLSSSIEVMIKDAVKSEFQKFHETVPPAQKKQKIDSSVSVDLTTTTGQSELPPTLPLLFKHDALLVPDKEFQEHFCMVSSLSQISYLFGKLVIMSSSTNHLDQVTRSLTLLGDLQSSFFRSNRSSTQPNPQKSFQKFGSKASAIMATKRHWDGKKAFVAGWSDDLPFLKACQKIVLPLWTIVESSALASDSPQDTQQFTQLLEELQLKKDKVGNKLVCNYPGKDNEFRDYLHDKFFKELCSLPCVMFDVPVPDMEMSSTVRCIKILKVLPSALFHLKSVVDVVIKHQEKMLYIVKQP